jgi:hypothetical protein
MSGGGSYGGGGGVGEDVISCSDLRFHTSLNSPVPEVVETLKPKDVLTLERRKSDGPVLAVNRKKQIAGSIAGGLLLRLIKCMESGYDYEAVVMKVTGGNVEVEVRHSGG